jgi:glyoxylase-like metal-dependent hydrolase (beta-lactamase superfamily II)
MVEVKVLFKGKHEFIEEETLAIGSTVTLIKGEENILVDTGTFHDKEEILNALKKEGLEPEDIDKVILTHLHLDHMINVNLFNRSKIFLRFIGGTGYPGMCQSLSEGTLKRQDLSDGAEISKDVSIIHTPGHTGDMISVVVKTKEGTIVVAGDAISDKSWADLSKKPNPTFVVDTEKYDKSREKILKIADYIIPGHGDIFKV